LKAGFDSVLTKPCLPDDLYRAVAGFLRRPAADLPEA